jgi:hypothetical protein
MCTVNCTEDQDCTGLPNGTCIAGVCECGSASDGVCGSEPGVTVDTSTFGYEVTGNAAFVLTGTPDGSGDYAALPAGTITITGLTAGGQVTLSLATIPDCGSTGCAASMSVAVAGGSMATLTSTTTMFGTNCGTVLVTADGTGKVTLTVTNGAPNVVIQVTLG